MKFAGSLRPFLALIICIFHLLPSLSQQTKTDLEKMNLRGRVKSIEYESYTFTMKKKKKSKEWIQTFFNEAGNKIREFNRDEEDPEIINRHEYAYDETGSLISIAHFRSDSNLKSLHIFSYDSTTMKEEEQVFDRDSTLSLKYIYQFNEKGQKLSIDGYDLKAKTNNHVSNYAFQYDEYGNKTEEITTTLTSTTTYRYRYDYGDSAQILVRYITLIEGENFETSRRIMYVYDDRGNMIEENWAYGEEPYKDKSTYTFDKKFNWIKRVDLVNGKEAYFAERKITYY